MLIDSHCHLDKEYFPEGPAAVLERGRKAGVKHFVVIGVGNQEAGARMALRLSGEHADVSATVGVHPHDAAGMDAELRDAIDVMAAHERVVAVGEAGLDYHYDHSPREKQQEVFREMIALAKKHRKPLVVHTRSAAADTLALLEEEGAPDVGGIIHCFSEDWPFAVRALDLGFDISFSGIVTFKNAKSIQDVARRAPAGRIMVETDSPYLAPVPLRGKRNEPANVVHTARYLAELRGERFEDLAARSTKNAIRRLGLAIADDG